MAKLPRKNSNISKKSAPRSLEQRQVVAPTRPSISTDTPMPNQLPTTSAAEVTQEGFTLIRFDRRTKLTVAVMTAVFLLMVLAKLHFVSLPIWNKLIPDGSIETRGLVAGTPKQIRMDDYAVGAPWIISNINNNFPIENESVGGLRAPMLVIPVRHIANVFKPYNWGYFLFDAERGYAFAYDSSPYLLLLGAFLFFMLVTGNQYGLSLTGAIALTLSSGTAWWSFIPAVMIAYCCGSFVVAVYLIYEHRPLYAALYAITLVWFVISYILVLYPPYQVPLAYAFIFVLLGYLLNNWRTLFPLRAVPIKLAALAGAAILAGWILSLFYADAKDTIQAVSSTVYPGQRSETGGTGFIANWYSEYYSWFFNDQKFPKGWLNICEMSHYLNFAPVIIPLSIVLFVQQRRIDWMLAGAMLFVVLMWFWIEVGYPEAVAKATLMSVVPTRRGQISLGVGGIVLLILYVSKLRDIRLSLPIWGNALALAGIVGFVVYTAYVNVNDAEGLLKPYQTFLPVVFFSAMNALLLFSLSIRYRVALFCSGLVLFLLPNLKANPLSKGLTPITENAFYLAVKQLVDKDPAARWMVNGNQFITYMVTATGAKQITGVKYIPDRKHIFSVLDPKAKRDSAYNRYAHVTFSSYIDGRDSVILVNQFEDGYVIAMDPCSPKMKQMNVKYIVFDKQPQPVEIRCMKLVQQLGSLQIFRIND